MRLASINDTPTNKAKNSATIIDSQTPVIPKNSGNIRTATVWKTSVLKKEIIAEVKPSFSAVKKPDEKIAKPINKKLNAKILNPDTVNSKSSGEWPTKILDSGTARSSATKIIVNPVARIRAILFVKRECSSFLFCAPK